MLASLTPREERVLRMRFGIAMNTDHTLEEVGQRFSVTRERIRQIEAKALRKLKHPSRSRKLRGRHPEVLAQASLEGRRPGPFILRGSPLPRLAPQDDGLMLLRTPQLRGHFR